MYKNLAATLVAACCLSPAFAQSSAPIRAAWVYVTPLTDAGWTQQHDQGRRAVKPEHFEEYGRQNGLFFLKAGCVMAVIGALDALVTLDALLYLLLYVFGFAFAFYPLTRWCKANEGFSWPWPHVKSEKKRIRELRKEQEQQKKK